MIALGRAMTDEWRLLHRHGIAWPALALLLVLLSLAAGNGHALVTQQKAAGESLVADFATLRAALAPQAERGVAAASSPGAAGFSVLAAPAVLPPTSLAALAIGQSDLLPSRRLVTARGAHQFAAVPAVDNALRLSIASFDMAFVIVWMLPLLIIAATFDLASGDRERGVLALVAAQGVRIEAYLRAKCLARAAIVIVPLLVGIVVTAALTGVTLATAATWASLGVWMGAAAAYALFWFALGLFVNASARSSDENAVWLAGAWLAFVVVIPAATNLAATTVFAAPSRVELTTELREATEAADRAAAAERDRYFFDHPDLQGAEMDRTAYFQSVARSEASVAAAMQPLLANFRAQAAAQRRAVDWLQYLSPGTLTYQSLTRLAGSDGARHGEYQVQIEQFHQRWSAFFTSRLERGEVLSSADYAALPQFAFREPPLRHVLAPLVAPLVTLCLAAACLFGLANNRLRTIAVT
jgi:ABC-2 type transport system permease protein